MITAELLHNPYLQKTEAKFNGQKPRINCELEKYEHLPLADWVDSVPHLFYNEMNGYDFDLDFIGTRHDFEIVKEAFKRAGVSEEDVRLFLKNEMDTPDKKHKQIDEILEWLKNNRNRRFNYDLFMEENKELFTYSCSYILVRLNEEVNLEYHVHVENVDRIQELDTTVLSHTPILFYLQEETMAQFRLELVSLLKRDDVRENQLFFLLHPNLNEERVLRVISDLGVSNPQKVISITDEKVLKYLTNYPITEYVRDSIKTFKEIMNNIQEVFHQHNSCFQTKNKEVHEQILMLERVLSGLNESLVYYQEHDNYKLPDSIDVSIDKLKNSLLTWRKKSTKIKGEDECYNAAYTFYTDIQSYMNTCFQQMEEICIKESIDILNQIISVYEKNELDLDFKSDVESIVAPEIQKVPAIVNELLSLKQIVMEQPSGNFFDLFKKPSNEPKEAVPVTICMLEDWRNLAINKMLPILNEYTNMWEQVLNDYYHQLCCAYAEKIKSLILRITDYKEEAVSNLSDEDKIMQIDSDWINEFKLQLDALERN